MMRIHIDKLLVAVYTFRDTVENCSPWQYSEWEKAKAKLKDDLSKLGLGDYIDWGSS